MITDEIRKDFPLLLAYPDTVYLDSAATAQKPQEVIDAQARFYLQDNANPLRGLYELSQRATDAYENAREDVRRLINASSEEEIIFTRNASESLNLLSYSYAGKFLKPGDEIVVTVLEHHSNFLPWQQAAKRARAVVRFLESDEKGRITEEDLDRVLNEKTRMVCMTQVSNVLGVKNDIKAFAKKAHDIGAVFVCDAAQSVPHMAVDVRDLDVDFLAFSGHKMCGPMGIGVLYGKKKLLNRMDPFLYGGEMIEYVERDFATWAVLPHKFEAGTVNAAGAAGLAAAIRYYEKLGIRNIEERENRLSEIAFEALSEIPHLNLLGPEDPVSHHGIFTFTLDDVHPHDIAAILDSDKICVRAGHHCAQPLMQFLNVNSTVRISLFFYNTEEEIRKAAESLKTVRKRMGYGES